MADEPARRRPLPYIPRMTRTMGAALGIGGLLLTILVFGSDGPTLTSPDMHSVVEGAPRIHQGDTVTIGSMFGCLDETGSVSVTDIVPIDDTGLEVTGWAVRPNPYWKPGPPNPAHVEGQIGVEPTTLAMLRFPASRVVDAACGKNGEGVEFAVQVRKTTSGEAGASGWIVTYTSDGKGKSLSFPLAVKLCNTKAWSKSCEALRI